MYKPISCVRTGEQTDYDRFIEDLITIKHWRCNLSALSHVYNLYFLACNDEIYVYAPLFPDQHLDQPSLILAVPRTGLETMPGIDLSEPHSVTRLHVDYLGNTEVLLVTCDDGDVVGWRVTEIHRAILAQGESSPEEDAADDIRCFEHHNAGSSAWGLAVHRNARLLAVSANTHRVRVIAYGLSHPDDPLAEHNDFPFSRHQNRTITLHAQSNIPSVSFDNTGEDPAGRWLASSSIDGLTHLWDLSKPNQPARVIAVGYCASVSHALEPRVPSGYSVEGPTIPDSCACMNRNSVPHAAWAAMFIEPRSCHRVNTLADACGTSFKPRAQVAPGKPYFWDITDKNARFSLRNAPVPAPLGVGSGTSGQTLADLILPAGEADEDLEASSEDSDQISISTGEAVDEIFSMLGSIQQITADAHAGQGQLPIGLHDNSVFGSLNTLPPDTHAAGHEASLFVSQSPSQATPAAISDEVQSDEEDMSTSGDDTAQAQPKKPYCTLITANNHQNSTELIDTQPRPMVIVTKEEIYLFQNPLHPRIASSLPILTMRNPLCPPRSSSNIPGIFAGPTSVYHRQCYTAQIPELGVFIVGSPAGRVGVFRLTRTPYKSEHCNELIGFRLDHLLPLSKKEGQWVPDDDFEKQLAGIAVGPVQGMYDAGEGEEGEGVGGRGTRRWRLMMYYHCQWVYAYELGKFDEEGEITLDELDV